MKTTKLVIGIVAIVLSVVILFQSCAASAANAMSGNGEVGGSAGFILALCLMIGGIVGIATRNSMGRGGQITAGSFFVLGAGIGALMTGSYSDLYIWAGISVLFGAMYLVSAILDRQ
ncbi:hypothetical protein [Eubacterium aggregans]|uniref:hypothetical protein n=1 Tax=Eubacterium aggregans TaxID=81409 RepID=UPI003F2F4900